jgi:hypothetical protein
MKYLIPFITAAIGFLVGLLIRRKPKTEQATVPIDIVGITRLYEQIRKDIIDDIERGITIEKLRKRIGL